MGKPRPLPASGISTRHWRQAPTGSSSGWSQNRGIWTPTCSAARITRVPLGTLTSTPSMVRVTRSVFSTLVELVGRRHAVGSRGGEERWRRPGRTGSRRCVEVREVLVAEVLDRGRDRAGRAVAERAERAAEDVVALVEQQCRGRPRCPGPSRGGPGSAPATRCPRGTACTCRRTRACRTRSSAAPPAPRRWSRRRSAAPWCRASSRPRRRPRSRAARRGARRSAAGCDEPPGVQNFSSWPSRMPPARSSSSRRVMPSGASYWPGCVDVAGQARDAVCPWTSRCPSTRTSRRRCAMMLGTEAIDSTLLMTVGLA